MNNPYTGVETWIVDGLNLDVAYEDTVFLLGGGPQGESVDSFAVGEGGVTIGSLAGKDLAFWTFLQWSPLRSIVRWIWLSPDKLVSLSI